MTPIDPERWRRLRPILDEVLELSEEERRSRLDAVCGKDSALRAELEALLRADAATAGMLDELTGQLVESALPELRTDRSLEGRLLPGVRVAGRYRIVSLLGRGGMGEVYRADDLKLGQAVALKFLPSRLQHNPEYLERLLGEAKLARKVTHPNVCRVHDIGEWSDRHFLSMEYIDGEDLASLVRRIGHLPQQKAIDIARQLCAGLDAAHQLGILHRDLKPANVMLDGNGRVRITDFGLAVAAGQIEGREVRSGTPAYMAPEQLDGREATARSDVYAMGLVLYELFTGRRAFQAATIGELRRLQEESSPTNPSALVDNVDRAVERAILRCLEKDPALRPASAREVAAGLPGGDPLAAALAAGETPSPELIAASGPEGLLSPSVAFATLGVTILVLVGLVLLNDRASTLGWVPLTRSPEVLEDNARGILEHLGYDARPVDRARIILAFNLAYRRYVQAHNGSPDRWKALRDPGQLDATFLYGQAQRHWVPLNWHGIVALEDPAPAPGDTLMGTDLRGRLFWLLVHPREAEAPAESATFPEWSRLFEVAGLEPARFRSAQPTRNPPVTSDVRAAWTGTLPDFGGYPVRVEAAALRGKPVFFELVFPWDSYWDPSAPNRPTSPSSLRWDIWRERSRNPIPQGLFLVFAFAVTAMLVVRNWLSGRGDRRGAFCFAAAVFLLRLSVWIFGGHHVSALPAEYRLAIIALGKSLTDAAAMWCAYVALEPYARRLHPRLLVSWTRVLRGRAGDPLVGRDILLGVAASMILILFWAQLYVVIPHALGLNAPPQPNPYPAGSMRYLFLLDAPPPRALLGGRYVLEGIVAQALGSVAWTLLAAIFVLGLRLVFRKTSVALTVYFVIVAVVSQPTQFSGPSAIGVGCSLVGGAAILWTLSVGLVSTLAFFFCFVLWTNFPITANSDAPFFSIGLVALLIIAGLGAYGAVTAARPRAHIRATHPRPA